MALSDFPNGLHSVLVVCLTVLYCQSINNKFLLINDVRVDNNLDAIVMTKTWHIFVALIYLCVVLRHLVTALLKLLVLAAQAYELYRKL